MTIKVGVIHKLEGSIYLTQEELTDDILRDENFYYFDNELPARTLVELQDDLCGFKSAYDALADGGYPISETIELSNLIAEIENAISNLNKQKENKL